MKEKKKLTYGNSVYNKILDQIDEIEILDTHEHIRSQEEINQEPVNIFKVFEKSYARYDYNSAGFPQEIWKRQNPKEIWKVFKEFQKKVSLTTYTRNIIRFLQDLYGLEGEFITENNWIELSEKVKEAYEDENWYNYVLKKRSKFKISFLDSFWSVEKFNYDPKFFIPVLRTDAMILGRKYIPPHEDALLEHTTIEKIAQAWNIDLDDFESFQSIVDIAIKKYKKKSSPAIKIATAYVRSLYFEKVEKNEASLIYAKNPARITFTEQKKLQDYMFHYIIQKATEENLPVQIHTGIFARNINTLSHGNPEKLNNIFIEYPDTKFVLFHFSYPYTPQVFSLAKMFPNVFLDFCWVPMISINIAKRALNDFLDLIPYNKLMWGGDASRVEEAYAGSRMVREVIASVLAERVQKKNINIDRALEIASAILHDNALNFYNLSR